MPPTYHDPPVGKQPIPAGKISKIEKVRWYRLSLPEKLYLTFFEADAVFLGLVERIEAGHGEYSDGADSFQPVIYQPIVRFKGPSSLTSEIKVYHRLQKSSNLVDRNKAQLLLDRSKEGIKLIVQARLNPDPFFEGSYRFETMGDPTCVLPPARANLAILAKVSRTVGKKLTSRDFKGMKLLPMEL
jgi:hypothetical protein